ncbi:hypothetical protein TEA_014072 [Camellia sinensis var. sinensis]|uniref:phenylalanine--tRNA ligase n=1 Tax=Camellia sinensis var. sinensis TaxID=542762 RepID=A0A4S4DC10_CAMSN|nr:hypothetical protein TEA_014072 [Camellia sinensis var. sinensis]
MMCMLADNGSLNVYESFSFTCLLVLMAMGFEGFAPKKYFSIDRVFRNEAVDRTHLAEFHQIEGLVCDRGLTLGDLIGVFNDFFSRLGMSKLKFKPAYNPYTEPSMEIFGYHEGLKKWVEIGNSGMFRPEMLLPMGLPEDVRVIAWGLSLERPTMILYGIDSIRDLFGHKRRQRFGDGDLALSLVWCRVCVTHGVICDCDLALPISLLGSVEEFKVSSSSFNFDFFPIFSCISQPHKALVNSICFNRRSRLLPYLTPTLAFVAVCKLLSPEIRTCGLHSRSCRQATSNAFCIFAARALPVNPARALP